MSEQCINEEICTCGTHPANEECDMSGKLICLADEAWSELLKEKMKAEIQKSCGEDMDKIAKFVTDTNNARWSYMIKGKAKCEEYKQKLKELIISSCD